jgi:putative ABC transport system permease protein
MDLRYAARHLVRHPRFAIAAIATLALGIGATSAVYAVVDAVYLKPPPYSDPDRIVSIRVRVPGQGSWGIAAGTMTAVAQLPVVQQAAVAITSEHTLSGGDRPLLVSGEAVSGEFFAVLGVQAALGRTLSSHDDPDTSPIVLGHALWRRSFGANPAVLGRSIALDGTAHTVVGVMPPSFRTLEEADYWTLLPLRPGDLAQSGRGPFDGYARLRTDDHRAARSQAAAVSAQLAAIDGHPAEVELAPIADAWPSVSRTTLMTLLGAVSLVLLIACANVANLLLARGQARRPELAVRAALGATRGRLVRQLLVEALVLAGAAAAAGLALAWVLLRVLFTIAVPDVARISEAAVDWRTAAFTAAVAAASVVLFGMAPAVTTAWRGRPALTPQRTVSSRGGRRLSQLLIGLEVALTLALLAAGVTMLGRLHALLSIETGFNTDDLHVVTLRPSGSPYPDTAAFYTRVVTSLQ